MAGRLVVMANDRDPSLDDLSVFLAVCEAAGFRAAARRLGRAPSNVSETVSRVEAQLGVALLHRTTRSVMPTEAGRELLARIAPLLAGIRLALHDVTGSDQQVRGLLKLNVTGAVMVDILPPLIDRFLARHPATKVELVVEDRLVDAIAGGCMGGIRYGEHLAQDRSRCRSVPVSSISRWRRRPATSRRTEARAIPTRWPGMHASGRGFPAVPSPRGTSSATACACGSIRPPA